MQITSGIIKGAQKVVIYGPEGIGKSSFAAKFPGALFEDTEGSTKKLDVKRTPKSSSWAMLFDHAREIKANPYMCDTFVIDTADWAEKLCKEQICSVAHKDSIADFGYGNGYTYLAEEFGRLLNLLEDLIDLRVNVVIVAHAQMRKFEQPDEMGSYDRWELKLEKKVFPLLKEWADMVLFCNYKTYVVNVDGQGAEKGKNKAQGGKRVMYTTHHACWDAKNRHDLQEELDFNYEAIRHCIYYRDQTAPVKPATAPAPEPEPTRQEAAPPVAAAPAAPPPPALSPGIYKPLADLMAKDGVTVEEVQQAVASRGRYYTADTPIENYDQNFVKGVLVAAWPSVLNMVKELREEEPF